MLYLIGCITEAPGSGEVIKIASAFLTGENIEHDALAELDRIAWCAYTVRNAAVSANRKNGGLWIFSSSFCQPEVDQTLHFPDRQNAAVFFHKRLIYHLMCTQKILDPFHDVGGDVTHLTDFFDFSGVLGSPGFQDDLVIIITHKMDPG